MPISKQNIIQSVQVCHFIFVCSCSFVFYVCSRIFCSSSKLCQLITELQQLSLKQMQPCILSNWCRSLGTGSHEHCSMNTSSVGLTLFLHANSTTYKQNISLCRLHGTCGRQNREHERVGTLHYYFLIILQLKNAWQMTVHTVARQML